MDDSVRGESARPCVPIRTMSPADWPAIWTILEPIVRAGETLAFAPDAAEEEIRVLWLGHGGAVFVALESDGTIAGTSFIKPNQPGLGAHVANAGYAVDGRRRGRGIASALCAHSIAEARRLGYRAMQFNFVVSTNERAVRLWLRHGFAIIGTLPGAFRHSTAGYVDVHVMFRSLDEGASGS